MKRNIICLWLVLFGVPFSLFGQEKYDYNWLFGISKYLGVYEFRGNLIDFNNKGEIDTLRIGLPMGDNNTSISDKNGNLLFYSNGCKILNWEHKLIENGDSINYGESWESDCFLFGYSYPQNSIILPDPGNEMGYYYIHKRREIISAPYLIPYTPELSYSYVDFTLNNGKGMVTVKNKAIFRTSNILSTYLSACKHANGEDWWIIEQKIDTNIYFKVLLSKDTIMAIDSQSIGPKLSVLTGFGQAVFTPDGSKYLMFTETDGALIHDFNRETGELSNFRQVEVQDSGRFLGAAISSNSRYAYLSALYDLYQIDLWADDIQSTLTHIDHIDGFQDPYFYSLFNQAQLAPDCKIYIVSAATNNYLHVINKPNEKGKACDFKQHSLYLPNRNFNNSIPNFPHFRIDEEDICDSTISWIPELILEKSQLNITISPNPATTEIRVSAPKQYEWQEWSIFTISGKKIRSGILKNESNFKIHNLNVLEPGVYFVNLRSTKGDIGVGKFVLQ